MISIIKGPYLQWPTENAMTFMWETSEPADTRVEVYKAERKHSATNGNYKPPEILLLTASEQTYSSIHQLTVDDLEPGTAYFYRVVSENARGEKAEAGPHPFKTAVGRGEPFSFTVTSELGGYSGFDHSGGRINTNIFHQMQRFRPDLTLFVGDIVNDGRQYEDWDKYFFGPGRSFLAHTPSYCCPGNHECSASWYDAFFAFPEPKKYYSFNYGDVHFISLDSTDFVKKRALPGWQWRDEPWQRPF